MTVPIRQRVDSTHEDCVTWQLSVLSSQILSSWFSDNSENSKYVWNSFVTIVLACERRSTYRGHFSQKLGSGVFLKSGWVEKLLEG